MANCGLSDLRIVRPCEDWNGGGARMLAVKAKWMLQTAKIYETTAEAVADCTHVFATTARVRDQIIPEMTARKAATEVRALTRAGADVALLFGAERTGLQNEDIVLANTIITVPLNPAMSSLNLGQAVLLVCYEWLQAGFEDPAEYVDPTSCRIPATKKEMGAFFAHIDQELGLVGFFPTENMRQHMMDVIQGWVTRTSPTGRELRMLHGVLATISGRRLGGKPAHVPGAKGNRGVKGRRRRTPEPSETQEMPDFSESGES